MKKSKILLPALGILVLGTAASVTGTVAWFSANANVTVDGLQVRTQVSSNLLIAADTLASVAKAQETAFGAELHAGISATLEPVSTVDGRQFFYTTNANGTGDANTDAYTAYNPASLDAFRASYGVDNLPVGVPDAFGYSDIIFQLKAANTTNEAQNLEMRELTLTYGGTADANKAYRVGIFWEDISSANPSGTMGLSTGTAAVIYAPSGAANFSDAEGKNFAVSAADGAPTQLTVTGNKYNNVGADDANYITQVPANTTKYYKMIVRLWIEGEDTTCKNDTFAALTNSWSLNLSLALDKASSGTAAVSSLTTAVTPAP